MDDESGRGSVRSGKPHLDRRAEAKIVIETVRDLLSQGIVPKTVAVGEVKVEVASFMPPTELTAPGTEVVTTRHRGHLDRLADRIAARNTAKVTS